MAEKELVWRIAGGSGDGIDSTFQTVAKAFIRSGLSVFTHRHYPSRIRGGHTYGEVRAAGHDLTSRGDGYNFLLALGDSFARNPQQEQSAYYGDEMIKPLGENLDDLREGGVIVYDEGLLDTEGIEDFDDRVEANDWHVYPFDLRSLAREHGREVMRNTAGVGATAALLEMDVEPFEELIDEAMSGDIRDGNLTVLDEANEEAAEREFTHDLRVPEGEHEENQVLLSGSRALAYGALDAGCRFISGYPMTPWTEVFTIMSQHLPDVGGIAEQVEDEIAAASLAIGASHAGVKAMSGSSGGGFALMSEPLGLAEMTETPLVLVEAMRAGPSTGMPTKTEQADLEHVLYTSQGDPCRVVFAPGTVLEAYQQARDAFRIAYTYHLPVIILIDQKLSGELTTVPEAFLTVIRLPVSKAFSSKTRLQRQLTTTPEYSTGINTTRVTAQAHGRFQVRKVVGFSRRVTNTTHRDTSAKTRRTGSFRWIDGYANWIRFGRNSMTTARPRITKHHTDPTTPNTGS